MPRCRIATTCPTMHTPPWGTLGDQRFAGSRLALQPARDVQAAPDARACRLRPHHLRSLMRGCRTSTRESGCCGDQSTGPRSWMPQSGFCSADGRRKFGVENTRCPADQRSNWCATFGARTVLKPSNMNIASKGTDNMRVREWPQECAAQDQVVTARGMNSRLVGAAGLRRERRRQPRPRSPTFGAVRDQGRHQRHHAVRSLGHNCRRPNCRSTTVRRPETTSHSPLQCAAAPPWPSEWIPVDVVAARPPSCRAQPRGCRRAGVFGHRDAGRKGSTSVAQEVVQTTGRCPARLRRFLRRTPE